MIIVSHLIAVVSLLVFLCALATFLAIRLKRREFRRLAANDSKKRASPNQILSLYVPENDDASKS